MSIYIKNKIKEYDLQDIILNWDENIRTNLFSKDIIDRLSVDISNGDIEKLLDIPVLKNSTTNVQVSDIY